MKEDTKFISADFLARHRAAIDSAMRVQLRQWGAHGWRIVGKPPRIRLEVVVPTTVQRPIHAVGPIQIADRWIKPSVVSSRVNIRRERWTDGTDPTAIGLSRAVAPGARVRVGRGDLQEFVGVAAVLLVSGRPSILTCGHAGAFAYSDEILAGDEPDGDAIATLETNLLEESSPLDAAVCPLTEAGLELLRESRDAPTWRFKKVKTPGVEDNDQSSVFWQTHDGDDTAPTAPVQSFSGETAALFGPRGPRRGFVETGHAVEAGDSGSLLSLSSSLYGLCSGLVGHTAFFTPIAAVITRINKQGKICSIYSPPAG
ncbi:MAG: hypothetical protein PHU25_14095 [Deltaproteobacteria bacterium]|nr:hypothetical protein [Deltaproteobacteria bacterium]